MADTLTPRDLVDKLLGAAASQALGPIGSVVALIIDKYIFPKFLDGWLFPKPDTDLFKQFEKRVEDMIDKKLEVAIGQATFERVKAQLIGLSEAFKGYANVVDESERKVRIGVLLTLADATVTDVESVPDRYLYLLTDALQMVAILHIAVMLEQVKRYPDHYEYQLALNKVAIRYSDVAGRIRDRFLWYRLGQIAGGKGTVIQEETGRRTPVGQAEQKKIRFIAYDDFMFWQTNPYHYQGDFLNFFSTDWVSANGMDKASYDKIQEAQKMVADYGAKEKQGVYDWWDEHLTKTTAQFMNFVDWDGEKGLHKPKDRMAIQAYPLQKIGPVNDKVSVLDRIDVFLGQQMDQFSVSGPRFVQTYRLPGVIRFGEEGNMFHRADTYDTALAAIYFALRGNMSRATSLADGLCTALEHDPIGGGRIVAATHAAALVDKDNNYATSVFYPDGATRDIGNMCWAGIALTRVYAKTHQFRYLYNALVIGNWIVANCTVNDAWQGFSGGEDAWNTKRKWRSVEHNIDAFAFFNNLFALTQDKAWQDAANRAKTLVLACKVPEGYYVTGTGEGQTLNSGVIPTDTQSWTALSNLNPDGNAVSLKYMVDKLSTKTGDFVGFKFAMAGSEVQNEVTAGAAMALYLQGGTFKDQANAYFESLEKQQKSATNTDGLGLVATPGKAADTGAGLGWKYFNWLHVASSAWTGLAFLAKENAYANPYALVKME